MKNSLVTSLQCISFTILTAASIHAQTPGGPVCKIVFDAGKDLTATPHHAYEIETSGRGKRSSEAIYAQGSIYTKIGDRWQKSAMNVQRLQQQEDENIRNARNVSCRYLRDESVGVQPAEVYSTHAETDGVVADTLVWLAKGSRRVLREEEDINQSGEKMHMSIRLEYTNVTPPAVSR